MRPDVIPRLALFANDWCRYFNNNPDVLIDLVVELALGCEQGAMQIINILLDTSLSSSNVGYHSVNASQSVKSVCREILELLLQKLDFRIRSPASNQVPNIPLLNSIKQDLVTVMPLLLQSNSLKVQTAVKLLSLLGTQSPNVLISSATFMLQNSETNTHLAALIRLISENDVGFASKKSDVENTLLSHGYFTQVVEHSIREVQYMTTSSKEVQQLFKNLTILLRFVFSKIICFIIYLHFLNFTSCYLIFAFLPFQMGELEQSFLFEIPDGNTSNQIKFAPDFLSFDKSGGIFFGE